MKCPACGAGNAPGRSSCSACAKPLGLSVGAEAVRPKYSSWSEKSGQLQPWQKDYVAPPPQTESEQLSAQNMDPRAMQEYYQGMQQAALGNNGSGGGAGTAAPAEASGFTAAGCVPFGLFAFANGQVGLGILGLLCCWIPIVSTIYALYIGQKGKELAWQGRHFRSTPEFESTMAAWNVAGWICLVLDKLLYLIFLAATNNS